MRSIFRRSFFACVAALSLGATLSVAAPTATAAAGDLAHGVVRVDADKDGAVDTTSPVGEADKGLAGVTVTALDAVGNVVATTTTATDGSWTIKESDVSGGPAVKIRIDTSASNDNVYATYTTAGGANAFARVGGTPNQASAALTGTDVELNALVYPVWKLDAELAIDPNGVGGKSILTGAGPFEADDTQPGHDSGTTNTRVRSADIVGFNWTLSTQSEDGSLGGSFTDAVFEQTITLVDGAVANFAGVPAVCMAGSQIVAHGGPNPVAGTVIQPNVDPPAGTTSVTLTCVLGEMGDEPAPAAVILGTLVRPSAKAPNGSKFETSSRFYAVDANGTATAQPDAGPEVPPIEITAAPRYDVEKINGDAAGGYYGYQTINGVQTWGMYSYYTVQISTDRTVGVEAFTQPVTMQEAFWAVRSVDGPNGEAVGTPITDLKWYATQCIPSPAPRSGQVDMGLVYGKIGTGGGVATAANSVRDSGTCTIGSRTTPDTGSYTFSMSGIDTSGLTYPTQTVAGSPLVAGPYYVASYRVQIFIPMSELDRTQGAPDDGIGEFSIYNRVGDFDPVSATGASNFGDGVEPGYCEAGPPSDRATNCDVMNGSTETNPIRSNNVVGPATKRISPGSWSKYFVDVTNGWNNSYGWINGAGSHDGAALVQPGQAFTSFQSLTNLVTAWTDAQMCDVFDNTVLKLVPLNHDFSSSGAFADGMYSVMLRYQTGVSYPSQDEQVANQADWVIKYGHVDLTDDDPNLGVFDTDNNRWEGNWTKQRAAASGTSTVCGSADITWYDSPTEVPGGVDAVNVAWVQSAPDYVFEPGYSERWYLSFEQRNTYNGGPHHDEPIPAGTVSANYGAVKTSGWSPSWSGPNGYVPGAGTTAPLPTEGRWPGETGSGAGDRWTVVRAQMRLQKRTVAGTVGGVEASGVSDYGVTGAAVAGRPVIWQITSTLTAIADPPADVDNVVVTDTLPEYVVYDEAGTAALAAAEGFPVPSSATVKSDGTTEVVWNLGTRTPNQNLPVLKIATYTDSLAPPNATAVNLATITATGIVPVPAHTDDHTIRIEQSGQVQLKKSVDRTLDLQGDNQQYTLQVKNFSQTLAIQSPTIYEVLPYNGDATNLANVNRTPKSDFAGTSKLHEAPKAFDFDGTTPRTGTFWYTTVPGEQVPQRLQEDTNPAIWSTTFTADATGFKFVAASPLKTTADVNQSGIKITFQTDQAGNDPGDIYTDRFTAVSPTLNDGNQLLTSNTVTVRVIGFSLGDFIFFDLNGNGNYDDGVDRPAPAGVTVQVRKADGTVLATTTTLGGDQLGRWVVSDLPTGGYYVTVPASEFATGGKLAGSIAGPSPVADPNSDKNEVVDHQAIADTVNVGGVRSSGLITLSADTTKDPIAGNEPLGDNVAGLVLSPLTTDDFSNLTLDLGLTPPASFKVTKAVAGGAAPYVQGNFTISVTCSYGGSAVPGYPKSVTLAGGGSETLTAPLGSTCTATETGNGGANSVVITPDGGITLTSESADVNTAITVTNTFDVGSLKILKEISGSGADLAGTTYTFSVTCSFQGRTNAYTKNGVTVTVGQGGTGESMPITDIPVGAVCTVTETGNGGADATPAPIVVTIDANSQTLQTVGFLNEFSAGTVELAKELAGTAKDDPFVADLEFDVLVTCQVLRGEEPITLYSGIQTIKGGETVAVESDGEPVLLPVGTHCWAEETVDQGATSATVNHADYENAAIVTTGNVETPQQLSLEVTNTFDQAELTVSKQVAGPAPAGATYHFTVACTYPVQTPEQELEGPTFAGPVPYPLADDDASFTLHAGESRTITVLAGVSCTVTETDAPLGATVAIVDSDAETVGGTADGEVTDLRGTENTVAFTNTFTPATITVSKKVVGPDPGGPYHFAMTCTYPVADGETVTYLPYALAASDAAFTLTAGQRRSITVYAGVKCVVTETDVPEGATVTIVDSDPGSADQGGDADGKLTATAGDGNTVEFTNTFQPPVAPPTNPTTPTTVSGGVLPTTGGNSAGVIWAAIAVLLAGGMALIVARRRRA